MLQSLPSICSGVSFPSFMTIFQSQLLLCRSRSLQPLLAFSTHSPQALYSRSCSSSCSSPLSTADCSSSSGQMLSFSQSHFRTSAPITSIQQFLEPLLSLLQYLINKLRSSQSIYTLLGAHSTRHLLQSCWITLPFENSHIYNTACLYS